jgi:hypothetical protein
MFTSRHRNIAPDSHTTQNIFFLKTEKSLKKKYVGLSIISVTGAAIYTAVVVA